MIGESVEKAKANGKKTFQLQRLEAHSQKNHQNISGNIQKAGQKICEGFLKIIVILWKLSQPITEKSIILNFLNMYIYKKQGKKTVTPQSWCSFTCILLLKCMAK